jgi:hypothetical protein
MEFRLLYKGPLRSAQSKNCVAEKHRLRKHFHRQLKEQWAKEPILLRHVTERFVPWPANEGETFKGTPPDWMMLHPSQPGGRAFIEIIADEYQRCGFRFVPLARKKNGFTCALDILFLRRGHPGDLIVSGDLDNRLKTLIDSLKIPRECSEVKSTPEAGEDPFFCLMEDDSLITKLHVTTDRLLTPVENDESKFEVEIILHVTILNPEALLGDAHLI